MVGTVGLAFLLPEQRQWLSGKCCLLSRRNVITQHSAPGPRQKRLRKTGGAPVLADVARYAGVSTATVSRTLNEPDKVSAQVKARVQTAVKKLTYVPHGAARALASQRSHATGIVVPTLRAGLFAEGVEALQRRLEGSSYTLLLASSQYDPQIELKEVHTLVEQGVDGIALVGNSHLQQVYDLLRGKRVPYINTYFYTKDSPHPCVGVDNRAATYRLTKILLDLGHQDFSIIASPTQNNDRAAERIAGVRACLAEHDVKLSPSRILEVPNQISDGRAALKALLDAAPSITAVLCRRPFRSPQSRRCGATKAVDHRIR